MLDSLDSKFRNLDHVEPMEEEEAAVEKDTPDKRVKVVSSLIHLHHVHPAEADF